MKKKGEFLLGEFGVKMIIAILCILVLFGIAAYLSGLFTSQTRQKQAQATLKDMNSQMKLLSDSNPKIDYTLKSPQDWYFFSDTGVLIKDMPNLCICPVNNIQSCSQGACIPTESLIVLDDSVKGSEIAHKSAENIVIEKINNQIHISK